MKSITSRSFFSSSQPTADHDTLPSPGPGHPHGTGDGSPHLRSSGQDRPDNSNPWASYSTRDWSSSACRLRWTPLPGGPWSSRRYPGSGHVDHLTGLRSHHEPNPQGSQQDTTIIPVIRYLKTGGNYFLFFGLKRPENPSFQTYRIDFEKRPNWALFSILLNYCGPYWRATNGIFERMYGPGHGEKRPLRPSV